MIDIRWATPSQSGPPLLEILLDGHHKSTLENVPNALCGIFSLSKPEALVCG